MAAPARQEGAPPGKPPHPLWQTARLLRAKVTDGRAQRLILRAADVMHSHFSPIYFIARRE